MTSTSPAASKDIEQARALFAQNAWSDAFDALRRADAASPFAREDLLQVGIERCARVIGTRGGLPALETGTTLDVANVIWCTGYQPGFSWIDLPIFDEQRQPQHVAGTVPTAPGLYFVGLHFLYPMSSTMIHGLDRDAARIANAVAQRAHVSSLFPAA